MSNLLQTVLPYPYIVGQDQLKLALELAYIAPRIGGVLISGKRGTAKSTTVRAFASMMYQELPVTIPINATEDRVVGGWQIQALMQGQPREQEGLLKEAHQKLLYIDEVNLLDDHIINIILDVTATGKLVVQREGLNKQYDIQTTLVGTMNPEEGGLRPQLLDRFGLMVGVEAITDRVQRRKILETVLAFDQALARIKQGQTSDFINQGQALATRRRDELEGARGRFYSVQMQDDVVDRCVRLAEGFEAEGHRSDYLLALAACAHAARRGGAFADLEDVRAVAELVLRHRQPGASQVDYALWDEVEQQKLAELLR